MLPFAQTAKADAEVLPAASLVVSGMDVLAEEFGTLTPEQLAAPISTVEVRASGRRERKEGAARRLGRR